MQNSMGFRKKGLLASVVLFSIFVGEVMLAAVPKKASVFVQTMKPTEVADKFIYPGRVKSRIHSAVTSEIEGQVIHIDKKLGHQVQRGDVILTLQNTDPVYRYAPIKVRATAAGYITTMDVSLQSKVERGQKLFSVTDPKNLLIETEIPAADLLSIRRGMRGEFKPNLQSTDSLEVEIEALSPVVDINTGTATAELKPLGKLQLLTQGQLGQITLQANARKSYVVPESALTYLEDKPFLRVVESGVVQKIPVNLGARMGDSFEITSGLKDGLQVVLRSSRFVPDGENVDVETPEDKSKVDDKVTK